MAGAEDSSIVARDILAPISGVAGNQAAGDDSISIRTAGKGASVNASRVSTIGATSGSGNRVVATGATYVESLDAGTVKGAFDFGTSALTGSNELASKFLKAFETSQTKSQEFQGNLLAGFQGITESTNSTLRDALATTLKSDTLAAPAATSAVFTPATVRTLAFVGAGLAAVYFLTRRS